MAVASASEQASANVGLFYFKARKWYPGAVQRFREVLTDDPSFTGRDTVYYYLAQALILQTARPGAAAQGGVQGEAHPPPACASSWRTARVRSSSTGGGRRPR